MVKRRIYCQLNIRIKYKNDESLLSIENGCKKYINGNLMMQITHYSIIATIRLKL